MKISVDHAFTALLVQQRALTKNIQDSGTQNVRTLGQGSLRNGSREVELLETRSREKVTLSKRLVLAQESGLDSGSTGGELKTTLDSSKNGSSEAGSVEPSERDRFAELREEQRRLNTQQAKMAAEAGETREAVRKIYDEMWAEVAKSRAERMALMLKTATEVYDLMRQCHESRLETSQAQTKAFLALIAGCGKD